ncbi:MAG TPA: YeeE/YedE family protein [Candidatus Ignatzschineria merdigallinarum]|uniref:YeeE/YedE family protein n=1 Tax=Candidatus Ignatzschineria merdigallinarum TaxID=2838621 RepID=A0A9D1Q3H8_9GAMM|nr:YeeE/YedE family protein [Candidatus Ignatzschineria merdigallinarum]
MTWFSLPALLGGIVIGCAAVLFLIGMGRIMGVSGILNNLLSRKGVTDWRLLFMVGLLISPWIYYLAAGSLPTVEVTQSFPLLVGAGLLVGVGSAMGSGCTSGHSICGISRFAPGSLIITVIFMIAGGVSVFILKHLMGGN